LRETHILDIAYRWSNRYSLWEFDRNFSEEREAQPKSIYDKKVNQETPENYHLFRADRKSLFVYCLGNVRNGYFDYLLFGFYSCCCK